MDCVCPAAAGAGAGGQEAVAAAMAAVAARQEPTQWLRFPCMFTDCVFGSAYGEATLARQAGHIIS
jgi:hypothetical protein